MKDIIVTIIMLLLHGIYMDNNWRPDGLNLGFGFKLGWMTERGLGLHLSHLCRLRTIRCCGF
jgi:hypothetical protein